jgi:uncharacterized membrane protein YdjX (TVP38/TMEM64 family)
MMRITVRAAAVAGAVLAVWLIHKTGVLERILQTIEAAGWWGPFIFIAVYALACVFFVPFGIFTFSGGMFFGFWKGAVLSVLGNGLGSVAAFLIGRYLARRWVERAFAGNFFFKNFSAALERKGWKIVLLARLSPVFPFSVGNYAFGTTRIPAWQYAAASMIGTIPSAMLCVYLGAVTGHLSLSHARAWSGTPGDWALLILGLIATVALFFFIRRMAGKAMEAGCPNNL